MSMQSKPSCVITVFHIINSLLVLVMLGVIITLLAFGFNPFGVADTIFPSGRILYWWTYSYEVQNYESLCSANPALGILQIQDCCRVALNRHLDEMGDDGWELVSLEMMAQPDLLGIEVAYRLTWKKPMSSIK